jgi:hypothetical protein
VIRRHALVLRLVFAVLLGPAAAAHAAGSVGLGKPSVAPVSGTFIEAQSLVQFTIAGRFKPSDPDEEGWIRFVWDFGDGTPPVQSGLLFGSAVQTHVANHSYDQGGIYTVTVTGGHGFGPSGFRYFKSKTFKINVACPGMDPGPKKCAKGTFSPFEGVWSSIPGEGLKDATLTLEQAGKEVLGSLTYRSRLSDALITMPVKGKMKYKILNGIQTLRVSFDDSYSVEGTKVKAEGQLFMDISDEEVSAYRSIVLKLEEGREAPGSVVNTFLLQHRDDENTAALCTAIGAGKRTVKRGGEVAFVVIVANEGLASLPADRARLDIAVEGGTIVQDLSILERSRPREADANNLKLNLAALGAGKGQANALSETFFVVRADPDARQISVTTSVFDDPTAHDLPFLLVPPPVRRICVPVIVPD